MTQCPGPPATPPIGQFLTRSARVIERAFDDAMTAAGGSAPIWLILIAVKRGETANQRELARVVGIQGATLTHHLNAMEVAALITRTRDPNNRRSHIVELTDEGDALFMKLRGTAISFDTRLRTGLSESDSSALARVLNTMLANVAAGHAPHPGPWTHAP